MEDAAKLLFNTLKETLDKESHVPVTNRLFTDGAAGKVKETWIYRSWSELAKVDLVEEGDLLNYRRILQQAKKDMLPKLKNNLEQNIYTDIILDLVNQQLLEYENGGRVDALYLLEMAMELSMLHRGNPIHVHLLSMIHLHREKYGSIELLRQAELPEDRKKREIFEEMDALTGKHTQTQALPSVGLEATLKESGKRKLEENHLEVKRGGAPDLSFLPKFKHLQEGRALTESQILATGLMLEALKEEEREKKILKIADMDAKEVEKKAHASLVRHWKDLEDKIKIRVSERLHDSERMKELKRQLWSRQQFAERILDFTEQANHKNEMVETYHKEMMAIKPIFRSEMGKKISSRPELAERIYNILDIIADKEISAFDYLDVAISLAKTPHEHAVNAVEADVLNDIDGALTPDDIVTIIENSLSASGTIIEISSKSV